MFENQNAKTQLMIVCEDKLREYANYLIALVGQKDDTENQIVGVKDGTVTAAIYSPKQYNVHPILIFYSWEILKRQRNIGKMLISNLISMV